MLYNPPVSQFIQLTADDLPDKNVQVVNHNQSQSSAQRRAMKKLVSLLKRLLRRKQEPCKDVNQTTPRGNGNQELTALQQQFESCINLYLRTFTNIQASRHHFQQVATNKHHSHSMLVAEIVGLQYAGVSGQVGGKSLIQMLEELRWMEQQVPAWTYQNICTNMLKKNQPQMAESWTTALPCPARGSCFMGRCEPVNPPVPDLLFL